MKKPLLRVLRKIDKVKPFLERNPEILQISESFLSQLLFKGLYSLASPEVQEILSLMEPFVILLIRLLLKIVISKVRMKLSQTEKAFRRY